MNLLKQLFGIKNKPKQVDPQLFMENNPPIQNKDLLTESQLEKNEIKTMNNKTHYKLERYQFTEIFSQEGEQLGYNSGNYEAHENRIRNIKAEFRIAVDKEMEEIEDKKFSTRSQIIDNRGLSERLHLQYELKLEQVELKLQELEEMKSLSVDGEGLIAPALHAFEQGFIAGLESKNKENNFFNPIKIYA